MIGQQLQSLAYDSSIPKQVQHNINYLLLSRDWSPKFATGVNMIIVTK